MTSSSGVVSPKPVKFFNTWTPDIRRPADKHGCRDGSHRSASRCDRHAGRCERSDCSGHGAGERADLLSIGRSRGSWRKSRYRSTFAAIHLALQDCCHLEGLNPAAHGAETAWSKLSRSKKMPSTSRTDRCAEGSAVVLRTLGFLGMAFNLSIEGIRTRHV